MADGKALTLSVFGIDVSASAALRKVGATAEETSAQVSGMGVAAGKAGKSAETAFKDMGAVAATSAGSMSSSFRSSLGLGIPLAAAAAGVASIKMASDFQKSTTLLVTAGGESIANLGLMRDGILKVSDATGITAANVSAGAYIIEKSGARGADALKILGAAAEGATAEGTDMQTMATALTSAMQSFNIPASDATKTMSEMDRGAGLAKTTMQEFAGSLSTMLPVASMAKLRLDDVMAAEDVLTQHGTSAQEATQELAFTIRSLQAPSQVAQNAMQQLGLSVTGVQDELSTKGLGATISTITDAIQNHLGPAGLVVVDAFRKSASATSDLQTMLSQMDPKVRDLSQQFANGTLSYKDYRKETQAMGGTAYATSAQFKTLFDSTNGFNQLLVSGQPAQQTAAMYLKNIMGGATGLNTALMLGGSNMTLYASDLAQIDEQGAKAGEHIANFAEIQGTANVQMNKAKVAVENLGIEIGTTLLPVVGGLATGIADVINPISAVFGWFNRLPGPVKDAALAFGAFRAIQALGIFEKIGGSVAGLATQFGTLGDTAQMAGVSRMRVGMGLLASDAQSAGSKVASAFGGGYGLAIGAAVTGIALLTQHFQDEKPVVNDLSGAVDTLTGSLTANADAQTAAALASSGTLDQMSKAGVTGAEYVAAINHGGAAYDAVAAKITAYGQTYHKVNASVMDDVKGFFTGVDPATKSMMDSSSAASKALKQLQTDRAAVTDEERHGQQAQAASTVATAAAAIESVSYANTLADTSGAIGTLTDSTVSYASTLANTSGLIGNNREAFYGFEATAGLIAPVLSAATLAVQGNSDASRDNAVATAGAWASMDLGKTPAEALLPPLQQMSDALKGVSSAASDASTEAQFLGLQIDLLTGRNVTAEQAQNLLNTQIRDIGKVFADATKATKGNIESLISNTGAVNTATQAGQDLYDSVDKYHGAFDAATSAAYNNAIANGQTVPQALAAGRSAADDARAAFMNQAKALGINGDKAGELADHFGILNGIKLSDHDFAISAKDNATPVMLAINTAAQALADKTYFVYIQGVYTPTTNSPLKSFDGSRLGLAGGTPSVQGGIPGRDSVPALLMPGEAVIPTQQATKHRRLLAAVMSDTIPSYSGGYLPSSSGSSGVGMTVELVVKGDGMLAQIIRESATVVVRQESDRQQRARVGVR